MALLEFTNIGILGMAAAIPRNTIDNLNYTENFSLEEAKDIVEKTGIKERRFAENGTCSSDLCYAAAEKLIADMHLDRSEIDVLIFISQTPDYRMPATSILLQHKLGLSKSTMAFDISLGCSAFIYGLSVAYSLLQNDKIRKVLILDGETRSRIYSPKDRKTAFLFGDGGIATILGRDNNFGKSYFSLNSDGSLEDLIKVNAGGYRNPSSVETLKEKVVDEHGNIRTEEHGYMNGGEVFNFVIREIPPNFKQILEFADLDKEQIDYFVFHQANDFMNSYLVKKLKIDTHKVPSTIAKFGNTSSVSIPITIVSELKNNLEGTKKLLLSGFGVGMSWASAIIKTDNCKISELVEI